MFYKDVLQLVAILDELNDIVNEMCYRYAYLEDISVPFICNYVRNEFDIDEVYGESDIIEYVNNNMCFTDFDFDGEDIVDYVKENFYIEDLIDINWS